MLEGRPRKFRSDDTWEEIRRAWEAGETGASLALRYEVGLANLWRRRASEGWRRRREPDPRPEPLEGWERFARARRDEFEMRREETRRLAVKLAEAMSAGAPGVGTSGVGTSGVGTLEGVPLWHVGFVLAWRAERLGGETAAADREWMRRYGWTDAFWDDGGGLHDVESLDVMTLEANRAAWREDAGLPDGVAEDWP